MPLYFQKPENALKRANEFIDVGKHHRALNVLLDVIKSRRHRTWQKIHEPIIIKYLTLCVELKKSHLAKEGLFHYRNICQHVNIKSLEDVTRGYLELAEEKTEEAKQECHQTFVLADDLDHVHTPESILLSAVISKDPRERTDHVITPWVKFLWESYKHCLELLRNNSRVERLYHDIAQKAFRFCVQYQRKTEFRKLCDNLRTHLGHLYKHQNQLTSINLNNPESQAMHLETRLVQLDNAIIMELWQEAYKAIEDINGLMLLSNKPSKVILMASYYQKLALVFWKSGNILYHASSLFKYFHLSKELKRNITAEEIQILASKVVVSTLSTPHPPTHSEIDRLVETDENIMEKNQHMLASLLNLSKPPSRSSLIKDLVRLGILHLAHPLVQELYRLLEKDANPLILCNLVLHYYKKLNEEIPELEQYQNPIQDITIFRLLKMLSQVYISIDFAQILDMIPFVDSFYLENKIADSVRRNYLPIRIDHRNKCIYFTTQQSIVRNELISEGPYLQNMISEQIKGHLCRVYDLLNKAMTLIQPQVLLSFHDDLKFRLINKYKSRSQVIHKILLQRRHIIEERKEYLENICFLKEEEERKLLEQKQQKLREAEMERIARETEARTKQRILLEQSELKKKIVLEKLEQLKKTEIGAKLFEKLEKNELEQIDPEEIISRELEKERRELYVKLRKQERMLGHLERAKRIEEIALLKKQYEEFKIEDKKDFEKKESERIKQIIEERKQALHNKIRINRIMREKQNILNIIGASRFLDYQQKLAQFNERLNKEREKRLKKRALKRKEMRKKEWLLLKEEHERQRKIEEKRQEEAARKIKLEEIEAKKRAKELEIEEKLKKEKDAQIKKIKEEQKLTLRRASLWRERSKREDESNFDTIVKINTEKRIAKCFSDWSRSDTCNWRATTVVATQEMERNFEKNFDNEITGNNKDDFSHSIIRGRKPIDGHNFLEKNIDPSYKVNIGNERFYEEKIEKNFDTMRLQEYERQKEASVYKSINWTSSGGHLEKNIEKRSLEKKFMGKNNDPFVDYEEMDWAPSQVECRRSQREAENEIKC